MAGIGNLFSATFGVDAGWLKTAGVFDPTLDVDAPLFIDPFLLPGSRHKEFSECAFNTYENHFGAIYSLLRLSKNDGDKAWNAALLKFQLSEAKGMHGTCLGYSKRSTKGRGFGKILSRRSLVWAKEVIELGVKDPELFSSLPLFEDGVGPDLISDMVAAIVVPCIAKFNERIIQEIWRSLSVKLKTESFQLRGQPYQFLRNPYENQRAPLMLLPDDILKHLPMLEDARLLPKVAETNAELRERVNGHISEVFKIRNKNEKDYIRQLAMRDAASFQAILDLLKLIEKTPYDLTKDPDGLMQWRAAADRATSLYKVDIVDDSRLSKIDRIDSVVQQIIDQFRVLIEDNRLNRVFFVDGSPRHERFAQLLFYAIAAAYCDANGLDISPESDGGAGPVDFKFSKGAERVVVEIKLSSNSKVVQGYKSQLQAYMKAERAASGHYVLIDVGKLGNKWQDLLKLRGLNKQFAEHKKIHYIDGNLKVSASKLGSYDE